jgi:hypothetical protein
MWHVWGRGELYTGFWWGNVRERELGVGGRILLKIGLQEIGLWNVDWTYVAPDRDTCRTVVKAAMNHQVS